MTMRITFLVAGKGAQSGIALGDAAAQARGERWDDSRFQISDARNPRERGQDDRSGADEQCRSEARPAPAERAGDQLRRADRAEHAARAAADRLVPLPPRVADEDPGAAREHDRGDQQRTRHAEERSEQHADPDAESGADPDPVPAAHALSLV